MAKKMSQADAKAFLEQAQKTYNELRAKQQDFGGQVGQLRQQIAAKEREQKRANLTLTELEGLPSATKTYNAVGRMFLIASRDEIQSTLKKQSAAASGELSTLKKKAEYAERQFTEVSRNMQELKSALA